MKIGVISTPIFRLQPPAGTHGYSGLESLAWSQAKGLAELGHDVSLFAPDGSECPGVKIIPIGPEQGIDEKTSYSRWWHLLPEHECLIDNSVAGSENLLVKINGKSRWLSMEELYSWAMDNGTPIFEKDHVEILVKGLEVPSAVDIYSIEWKSVSAVTKHSLKNSLRNVQTRCGHQVKITDGHSLMVAGLNKMEGVSAKEALGKSAAIARRIPVSELDMPFWPMSKESLIPFRISGERVSKIVQNCGESIAISPGQSDKYSTKAAWKIWQRSAPVNKLPEIPQEFDVLVYGKKKVSWPISLDDEDLTFMGLWIGDGCYDGSNVTKLSSGWKTEKIASQVAKKFKAECKKCSYRPDVNHQVNSKLLTFMMRQVGFVGDCYTKKIPNWIFDLSKRQIGLFLKGYFSADGHATHRCCLNSVNETLIKQVSMLLSLCGIRSNTCKGTPSKNIFNVEFPLPMWELEVPKDEYEKFISIVGFVQEEKNQEIRKKILKRRSKRGDVPYCLVRQRKVRPENKRVHGKTISLSKLAKRKGEEIADKFSISAIDWRRVESNEIVESKDQVVYDLTVPGTENFFVGQICCHNSWSKWAINLKREGKLSAPILNVMHAPVNTMISSLPPGIPKPCFVCISEDQRSHFEALFNSEARVCRNGIDLEFHKPIDVQRTDRFLFLARYSTIKGPHTAIEACLRAGVGLDLVGDTTITNEPEYFQSCMSLAKNQTRGWDASKGKQIRVHGGCSRGETVFWFSQAHALLHPNFQFREPLGLAPLEAMACGCPVISTFVGAMKETISEGVSGKRAKNVDEFFRLVSESKAPIAQPFRDGCREWAKGFSIQGMCKRYEELCQEAVATGGW
jgi:intein/homing endonuclease